MQILVLCLLYLAPKRRLSKRAADLRQVNQGLPWFPSQNLRHFAESHSSEMLLYGWFCFSYKRAKSQSVDFSDLKLHLFLKNYV